MAEVVGTQLVLVGLLIAMAFQETARWAWNAIALSAVVVALVLTKEMFAATIPLLIIVAVAWQRGRGLVAIRWSRKNVVLVAACSVAALCTLVPLALVALNASSGAYTSTFGTQGSRSFRSLVWLAGAATPYLVASWHSLVWALLQLVAFISLVVWGWRVLLRDDQSRPRHLRLFALLSLHVAAGVISYVPWPVYQPFYAMPFLIAPATIVALAVAAIRYSAAPAAAFTGFGWLFVISSATVQAADYRRATEAEQRFNAELVHFLADHRRQIDSVIIPAPRPVRGARAWQGLGATLARYGKAWSYDLPELVDDDCDAARARYLAGDGTPAVVRYGSACAPLGRPDTTLVRRYARFDWDRMRPTRDSLFAELYSGVERSIR